MRTKASATARSAIARKPTQSKEKIHMIFIHDKIYAKVWKVEKAEKYIDLQVTTSEKDKEGNYINSGWFPRLIGHAFNALKDTIKEGDTLIITKCKITNERYEDNEGNKKSRFKFVVLEATVSEPKETDGTPAATTTPAASTPAAQDAASKDTCPW